MNLRPYQQATVEAVIAGWKEFRKQLVSAPTGSGKTVIFSFLAKYELEQGNRTLILAHREELIDQAIAKLHAATGIIAQKEKAEFSASLNSEVVVASVQTMIRRLDKWPKDHFGLVVADEAHHAISDSWQKVLNHFDGHARVLGVTATPDRGDKRNLGKYFEAVAYEIGLFDLIKQGYLSPISVKSVPLKIDLNAVRQTAGDFNDADLGDALTPYLGAMAQAIKEHAEHRRTLAFLPLRATSRAFVAECLAAGIRAEHIDGESPDRREILQRFNDGSFDLLSNAMLLTEGFDVDSTATGIGIDCVVVLRPTRSRSLYSQMVGRGTRIADFKTDLLLLDFLWMHEKHSLCRPAHLVAKSDEEAQQITMAIEKSTSGECDDLEDMQSTVKEEREEKLRRELEEKAKRSTKFIHPDQFAVLMHEPELVDYQPEMKWEERPMTPSQQHMLEKNGFDLHEIRGRGHASKMIDLIIRRSKLNLCTPKQMRALKRFGVQNPENISFEKASFILDARFAEIEKRKAAV